MKIPTKLCLVCGKEFAKPYCTGLPEWKTRRFCSRKCADVFKKGKPTWNKGVKTGIIPSTAFREGNKVGKQTQFSKGLIPWNKKDWFCRKCGKELEKKGGYCSGACRSEARKRPRPTKPCVVCGAIFTRKYSEDNKRWRERKVCSRTCQYKIQGMRGEKNHRWKGGITPLMNQIRTLTKYRHWYRIIFQRDNWTCRLCGVRSGNGKKVVLNADHYPIPFSVTIKKEKIDSLEKAIGCKKLWDLGNGRTLCISCHKKETKKLSKTL